MVVLRSGGVAQELSQPRMGQRDNGKVLEGGY